MNPQGGQTEENTNRQTCGRGRVLIVSQAGRIGKFLSQMMWNMGFSSEETDNRLKVWNQKQTSTYRAIFLDDSCLSDRNHRSEVFKEWQQTPDGSVTGVPIFVLVQEDPKWEKESIPIAGTLQLLRKPLDFRKLERIWKNVFFPP